jgi:hypothetical protein
VSGDGDGWDPVPDGPVAAALATYRALTAAGRAHEKLKRQAAERFAVLTAPQQQQYIDACERIDAAERGGS